MKKLLYTLLTIIISIFFSGCSNSMGIVTDTGYQNSTMSLEISDQSAIEKKSNTSSLTGPSFAAGASHTVAIDSTGKLKGIGDNSHGQLNVYDWSDIIAVSTGGITTVGLKSNGTVVATGGNDHGELNVVDWNDIIAISAGDLTTVGLKKDGTVVATGDNANGQCSVGGWSDIIAVAAGRDSTYGLKKDGTVIETTDIFGDINFYNYGLPVSQWTDIVAISAGYDCIIGLKNDGKVVAYGDNYMGDCEVFNWFDIVAISAGTNYTLGLKSNGSLVAVGDNDDGACSIDHWTGIIDISAGLSSTIGLKNDGTLVSTSIISPPPDSYEMENNYGQGEVSNLGVVAIPEYAITRINIDTQNDDLVSEKFETNATVNNKSSVQNNQYNSIRYTSDLGISFDIDPSKFEMSKGGGTFSNEFSKYNAISITSIENAKVEIEIGTNPNEFFDSVIGTIEDKFSAIGFEYTEIHMDGNFGKEGYNAMFIHATQNGVVKNCFIFNKSDSIDFRVFYCMSTFPEADDINSLKEEINNIIQSVKIDQSMVSDNIYCDD